MRASALFWLSVGYIWLDGPAVDRERKRENISLSKEIGSNQLLLILQSANFSFPRRKDKGVGGSKLLLKLLWGLFTQWGGAVQIRTRCRVWELIANSSCNCRYFAWTQMSFGQPGINWLEVLSTLWRYFFYPIKTFLVSDTYWTFLLCLNDQSYISVTKYL